MTKTWKMLRNWLGLSSVGLDTWNSDEYVGRRGWYY